MIVLKVWNITMRIKNNKGKKEKCLVYLKKIENEYILSYCVEDVKWFYYNINMKLICVR